MTTWKNGRVHDLLEPGSPQERLGTRLYPLPAERGDAPGPYKSQAYSAAGF